MVHRFGKFVGLLLAVLVALLPASTHARSSWNDDLIVFRFETGIFYADTAHDGWWAESSIRFGEASAWWPGEITDFPLMGDVDGDGGDDPCVFRFAVGIFYCDTAHDGGWAEIAIRFGETGTGHAGTTIDYPLMGDVDGDGRDDPCVHRVTEAIFYCDTAHDGGWAEVSYAYGEISDGDYMGNIALGDLDADGRDDICILRPSGVFCDTAHDGGWEELYRPIDGWGYLLIGDIDGNFYDEICLYDQSVATLFCDTANDGGSFEMSLGFGNTEGDYPVLGNLDGKW